MRSDSKCKLHQGFPPTAAELAQRVRTTVIHDEHARRVSLRLVFQVLRVIASEDHLVNKDACLPEVIETHPEIPNEQIVQRFKPILPLSIESVCRSKAWRRRTTQRVVLMNVMNDVSVSGEIQNRGERGGTLVESGPGESCPALINSTISFIRQRRLLANPLRAIAFLRQ